MHSSPFRPILTTATLARMSQRVTAARAQWPTMTALRLIRVLDVLFSAPARPNLRAPCPRGPLRPLASRPVETCGLASWVGHQVSAAGKDAHGVVRLAVIDA